MPKTGLSSEELVEKALEVAKANIRKNGLDKFRLIDVARELGVTHAALYNHFSRKGAVLDVISERWLSEVDARLEGLSRARGPVLEAVTDWLRELHRLKVEKVRGDPELYRSFNLAVESEKPFVMRHLRNMHDQLLFMVERAVRRGELAVPSPEEAVQVLSTATAAFHHPGLVLEHRDEDREPLLKEVVAVVLAGLNAAV